MICDMRLIEIIGAKDTFDQVVELIQVAGVLHMEEVPLSAGSSPHLLHRIHLTEKQQVEKRNFDELLQSLDLALKSLTLSEQKKLKQSEEFKEFYQKWWSSPSAGMIGRARSLQSRFKSFMRRRRNLSDDLKVLASYKHIIDALFPVIEQEKQRENFEYTGVIFDNKKKSSKAAQLLKERIEEITENQYRFLQINIKGGQIGVVIAVPSKLKKEIQTLIYELGINEFRGPSHLRSKPFIETLRTINQELPELARRNEELQRQMNEFKAKEGGELLAISCICRDRLAKLECINKFAQTKYTFIIKGWIPQKEIAVLKDKIMAACGEVVVMAEVAPEGTVPPVTLDNAKPVRPFERLLGLLPLPKYGTVDPTSFIAIVFPPIFGLMLGDAGYALILGFIAWVLYRQKNREIIRDLGIVLTHCACYTFLFGILFGEFFGTLGEKFGMHPIWQERLSLKETENRDLIMGYLAIALAIGVVHILLGLVLGIINARKTGAHIQVLDRISRIAGIFGLLFVIGRLTQFLPPAFLSIGAVLILVFLILVIYLSFHHPAHGLMLPLELLSTFGNILSYARIMAVGLVSVVLAALANQFGDMIGNFALALIVMILMHTLNLVLGIVDPTIQGMRLHYVEFFTKFYQPGGKPYLPFKKSLT